MIKQAYDDYSNLSLDVGGVIIFTMRSYEVNRVKGQVVVSSIFNVTFEFFSVATTIMVVAGTGL